MSEKRPEFVGRLKFAALLCGSMLAVPTVGHAQSQKAEATVEDDNTIIVTAQRRAEALEDIPMSVAVVTSAQMESSGVTSLRDLSNITSGFQLGAGGSYPQPALRGVTTIINGSFENNVVVYVDDVYQPVAQSINIDLPNVESVQVLKGPQGTLYGRNATGGAILLSTITPSDTWRGKAELTYARFDDKRASGYFAGPLSEVVGISMAGYLRRSDGYGRLASRTTPGATECCATPLKQDALRMKLRATPSDVLTATLAYNYVRVLDARTNVYSPIENVNPGGTFSYGIRPGTATRPTRLGVYAYDISNGFETRQHEGSLKLEWDTSIGKLRSITAYSVVSTLNDFDFDGTYIPTNFTHSYNREKTWQQSVDYAIDAIERLDLVVGGLYFHDRFRFQDPVQQYSGLNPNNPGTVPGTLADYVLVSEGQFRQKKEAWALFADATFRATDRLSLNVGGRYSSESQDVFGQVTGPAAFAAFGLFRNATTAGAKFSRFTPRVSLRYEISPRTNIYASYSQGFRSGAFNSTLPACVNIDPTCYQPAKQETIQAFEAGFKTAGRKLRFDTAGFYYIYKDLQVSSTQTTNGFVRVDITNAPKAKIYGADANLEWEPIDNLTIRASGTWLHARYGDGFTFSGVGVTNAGGSALNTNSDPLKALINVSQIQNLSGLQMSRAPNFSGNLGFDYLIPMGEGGLRLGANVKYTTRYVLTNPSVFGANPGVPVDRQREQRFVEGAYALVNASITWTDSSDTYSLRLWGTNLTNHAYRLHYTGTPTGTYSPRAEPRVYGVTGGFKF